MAVLWPEVGSCFGAGFLPLIVWRSWVLASCLSSLSIPAVSALVRRGQMSSEAHPVSWQRAPVWSQLLLPRISKPTSAPSPATLSPWYPLLPLKFCGRDWFGAVLPSTPALLPKHSHSVTFHEGDVWGVFVATLHIPATFQHSMRTSALFFFCTSGLATC